MSRYSHNRTPSSFFTGGELTRLGFSFVMLMVLVAAVFKARDPKMWLYFAREDSPLVQRDAGDEAPSEQPAKQPSPKVETPVEPAKPEPSSESENPLPTQPEIPAKPDSPAKPNAPAKDVATGPTDEDEDEREAAIEELQVVSDKTLGMAPEEMVAYWRFFSWVENQPLPVLKRRARRDLSFNHLMQKPDAHRGKIMRLDLNVVRVLETEAPDNSAGVEKVYELLGWSEDSKGWLYFAVVSELPPGMPIGVKVNERAQIYGYFFKLQGYLEAGAKPRAKPLAAPMLIGRVDWKHIPLQKPPEEPLWFTYTVTGGLLILMCLTAMRIFRRRKGKRESPSPEKRTGMSLDEWLGAAGREESAGQLTNLQQGGPASHENNGQTNGHSNREFWPPRSNPNSP